MHEKTTCQQAVLPDTFDDFPPKLKKKSAQLLRKFNKKKIHNFSRTMVVFTRLVYLKAVMV